MDKPDSSPRNSRHQVSTSGHGTPNSELQTPNSKLRTPNSNPEIVLIAAVAEENRVIGRDMELPWHLPEDLRHFKELTQGHALLMGRRTFASILHQFGGPLPERRMVVLTSRGAIDGYPEVEAYASVEAARAATRDEDVLFIGGGAAVYEQFLPLAHRLELTLVEGSYEGDTYFPAYEDLVGPVFEVTNEEPHEGFRFVTYRHRTSVKG